MTVPASVAWDDLKPYETQQGSYWLYGHMCDVYGNGKTWTPSEPLPPHPEEEAGQ